MKESEPFITAGVTLYLQEALFNKELEEENISCCLTLLCIDECSAGAVGLELN